MFTKRKNKQPDTSSSRLRSPKSNRYSNNKTISSYRFNQNLQSRDIGSDNPRSQTTTKDKQARLNLSKRKMFAFAIFSLMVIIIFWQLTLSRSVNVNFFQADNSPFRSTGEYQAKVEEILSKDFWSKSKFTINTDSIESSIKDAFPEIDGAIVRLPVIGRTPTVTVSIRQSALVVMTKSEGSVIVDKNGLAVGDTNILQSGKVQGLPVVVDQSDMNIELGKQVITSETVSFILGAKAQLDAKSIGISKLVLPPRANGLDMYLEGVDYYIKTDTSGDVRLQLGTYLALRSHLGSKGITPSQYVDVRVEERAFYK